MEWSQCSQQVGGIDVPQLSCIPLLLQSLINWAFVVAGAVAVFMIIFGGYKFISSGGDAKQVDGAKQTITWAIIGLVIILLSGFILNVISGFTGIEQIRYFGF